MASPIGKAARKRYGNRHACKRAKKKPGVTSRYAAKRARWVELERGRKRHEA